MSTPLDRLKVEVYTRDEDGFVLGLSRLGLEVLGSTTGGGLSWREIMCDANGLSFRRGGEIDGPSVELDAGYLSITLVNTGDPMTDPGMVPNIPIRVTTRATGVPLFTGTMEDVHSTYDEHGNVFVTLTAVDGIRELKNTPRYGSVGPSDSGSDTWTGRMTALASSVTLGLVPWTSGTTNTTYQSAPWVAVTETAQQFPNLWTRFGDSSTILNQTPDFRVSSLGWQGVANAGAVVRNASYSEFGYGWSLRWTAATANSPSTVEAPTNIPVTPGKTYTFMTKLRAPTGIAHGRVRIQFKNASNGVVLDAWGKARQTAIVYTDTGDPANYFTPTYVTAVAPPTATQATILIEHVNTVANSSVYASVARFYEGRFVTEPIVTSLDQSYLQVRDADIDPGSTVTFVPLERGVQRTLTGLVPGRTYTAIVNITYDHTDVTKSLDKDFRAYRAGVDVNGSTLWGPRTSLSAPTNDNALVNFLRVAFRATATSHTFRIARDFEGSVSPGGSDRYATENLRIRIMRIFQTGMGTETPIQDVNYESTVYNHMRMTCDSTGRFFFLNRENKIETSATVSNALVAQLSDKHSTAPLHMCYLDVEASYDTRNTVNVLEVDNHGRRPDPDKVGNYLVDDLLEIHEHATSVMNYGRRMGKIDTSIPQYLVEERAEATLETTADPALRVHKIVVDALQEPGVETIELFARVSVTLQAHTAFYRVIGIEHTIGKTAWTTTFALRKEQA